MINSSKYRFLSLAVIAVMSIVLAACGGDSGSGGGGAASMSNADLLKTAATNMKALKSYSINANINSAGQAITMKGDIDIANKNSKLDMGFAGTNISVVSVVSDTYISSDGGKTFTKADATTGASVTAGADAFSKLWNNFNPADVDKAASALKDGNPATEPIDGTATKHITGNAQDLSSLSNAGSAGSSSTMTGTVEIWISTDATPTVRQMKISGTSSGQQLDATIKWSNINSVPAITAPPTGN